MKVLITGATGFIGKHLGMELVRRGHEVVALARNPDKAKLELPYPCRVFAWDAYDDVPSSALDGVDTVVHLAGEPVAGPRWTKARKESILNSRAVGTKKIVEAISKSTVKTLISTSAIGIFGDRGDETLTETSAPGQGFLSEVCKAWEGATDALPSSVRKAIIRIGVVLSHEGGALKELLPIFRRGVGGPIAGGAQWMSWITLTDLVQVFVAAVVDERFSGVIHATAPEPATNRTFVHALAQAMKVPCLLGVPKLAMKAVLGEQSMIVLDSAKVMPARLQALSFPFQFPKLDAAIKHVIQPVLDPKKGHAIETLTVYQWVPQKLDQVFPFFSAAQNLEKLTPPWLGFKILDETPGPMAKDKLITYRIKLHGIPIHWKTEIEEFRVGHSFVDNQLSGPYQTWHHTHHFEALGGGTLMTDHVRFALPAKLLGDLAAGWKVRSDVNAIFEYRRKVVGELFNQ